LRLKANFAYNRRSFFLYILLYLGGLLPSRFGPFHYFDERRSCLFFYLVVIFVTEGFVLGRYSFQSSNCGLKTLLSQQAAALRLLPLVVELRTKVLVVRARYYLLRCVGSRWSGRSALRRQSRLGLAERPPFHIGYSLRSSNCSLKALLWPNELDKKAAAPLGRSRFCWPKAISLYWLVCATVL